MTTPTDFPKHDLAGRSEVPSTTEAHTAPALDVPGLVERLRLRASLVFGPAVPIEEEAASALSALYAQVEALTRELDEARTRLFPYADDKQISGMSWNGFYLIGNDKSIKELRRIENDAAQIEVYRAAFDERIAAAEAEVTRLRAELDAKAAKRAPVQGFTGGIPWEMHLRAYDAYCKRHGPQKALIEGGCRGGFGTNELDMFIPGWREELSERTALLTEVTRLRKALDDAPIMSKYHGHRGFEDSRFIADYELWRANARQVLTKGAENV